MASGPPWLVSGFRFRARLGFSIPSTFSGPRGVTPAFGYSAPHSSARGTSTLLINALLSAHCGPLRHPRRPGLTLTSCRLTGLRSPPGLPVLRLVPFCLHAVANTPAGPMGTFARLFPSTAAFPRFRAGRLLHCTFRGLHDVHFRYGLQTRQVAYATLYIRGFSSFVTSTTAPITTGWSEPVPGWVFLSSPLRTSAFSRRT